MNSEGDCWKIDIRARTVENRFYKSTSGSRKAQFAKVVS